jgi:pimeloyl-ACP methyl ester carboxylesterase
MRRRAALVAGAAAMVSGTAAAQNYPMGTKQRELRFRGVGGVTLAGTLLLPLVSELQKVPGVVLVGGSGPTDRDGNNRLVSGKIDLLKQIAELLAANGIASLRYDKRGIGASTPQPTGRLAEQELFWAWDSFIGDVQLAHAELVRHDEIKSYATAMLGHSEGGMLALAAAALMGKRGPYALVLASAPGRPLGDIVREQIGRNGPAYSAAAEQIMRTIVQTGHVPSDVPEPLKLIFPPNAGTFLKGALTFDPAKVVDGLTAACLMLHGAADTQVVPLGDIQPLIDALTRRGAIGEVAVFPLVSHNLKAVSGPGDPGFLGPIAPPVADKLAGWLRFVLGA